MSHKAPCSTHDLFAAHVLRLYAVGTVSLFILACVTHLDPSQRKGFGPTSVDVRVISEQGDPIPCANILAPYLSSSEIAFSETDSHGDATLYLERTLSVTFLSIIAFKDDKIIANGSIMLKEGVEPIVLILRSPFVSKFDCRGRLLETRRRKE